MGEFLKKFDNFIFDVMGLIFPGIVLMLIIAVPPALFDFNSLNSNVVDHSVLLSALSIILKISKKIYVLDKNYAITLVILIAYILGHVIKVFSVILYDLFESIFDETINVWVKKAYLFALTKTIKIAKKIPNNNKYLKPIYTHLKDIFSPIKKIIIKVFAFRSPDYFNDNESMKTTIVGYINRKLNTTFPNEWYSIFKLSVAINYQEGIKSLASNFLSKYNMYRSLSVIFGFSFFYFLGIFNSLGKSNLPIYIVNQKVLLLCGIAILWFTFHVKYKRYWTLCGNETLISLYYFVHKKQLNA
jgi:hypothetical protein